MDGIESIIALRLEPIKTFPLQTVIYYVFAVDVISFIVKYNKKIS